MRILTCKLKWVALGIMIAFSLALGISSTPMEGKAYAAPTQSTTVSGAPGVITYLQEGTQRISAFVSGTNGHLYVNYWNGSQWQWVDQGTPPGATVSGAPGVITYLQEGSPRIYAFISGTNGHLYMNYWNGSQWQWVDQGPPPGATVSGAPGVITYLQEGSPRISAFVSGTNGHLYMNYWNGSQWQWADQGTPPGTAVGQRAPGVITYLQEGTPRISAFVRGTNGHLYVNYWNGSQWQWADQGTPPGAKMGQRAPGVITYLQEGTQWIHAFVRGTNGRLYVNYWNGSQWQWADQGTPLDTTVGQGAPGVITYLQEGTQRIHAFVRGANSRLYVNYWNGSQWQWANQRKPLGTTVGQGASGVITYLQEGTQRIHAFVRGANGHLYMNYWDGSQWQWADQGAP